jgi:hypothetical protein
MQGIELDCNFSARQFNGRLRDMKWNGGRPGSHSGWVCAVALMVAVFVVYQWVYSGGFPYIRDGNESATSFVHALNLQFFGPLKLHFLTFADTDFNKTAVTSTTVYTHNPNFPRFVHYALLRLGVQEFTTQVLIIILPVSILNIFSLYWLLSRLLGDRPFERWISFMAVLAMALDYLGFLSFTVNTYRTYVFSLLWLSLLAVIRPWKPWQVFAIFFVLFQLEYGFATFVIASALSLWALESKPLRIRTAVAAIAGAGSSILIFFLQLISYESFAAILKDFAATTHRRGGGHLTTFFTETLPALVAKIHAVNSTAQNVILVWALASSLGWLVWAYVRGSDASDANGARVALARLFVSLLVGGLVTSALLTDYVLEVFFGSLLPFLTFFNVVATAISAADIAILLRQTAPQKSCLKATILASIALVTLAPMVRASVQWWRDYPGLTGGYIDVLKKHYIGKSILIMSHFPQMPTAITRGPTLQMTDNDPPIGTTDYYWFDRSRNDNGELIFLCLNLKWVDFDRLVERLRTQGNEILFEGRDYAFIGMKRDLRSEENGSESSGKGEFGAFRINLTLPQNCAGVTEPVLACGHSDNGNIVFVTYEDATHIRIGVDGGKRGSLSSPIIPIDYGKGHQIDILHGSLYPAEDLANSKKIADKLTQEMRMQVRVRLDDQTIIDAQLPLPPISPANIRIGRISEGLAFSGRRSFTGRILSWRRFWPGDLVHFGRDGNWRRGDFGCVNADVIFPPYLGQLPEPLATDGVSGSGDFIYVRYVDRTRVRIGFDHWGVRGFEGPAFTVQPGALYHLQLSIGGLFPPRGDALLGNLSPREIDLLKLRVRVLLNGTAQLDNVSECYDSPPIDVRIGLNQIGGSICGPAFTGQLRNLRRTWPTCD